MLTYEKFSYIMNIGFFFCKNITTLYLQYLFKTKNVRLAHFAYDIYKIITL